MGRYYNGDIEGKFWFGVQSSDDANFFGVDGCEPNYLDYYFGKDDLSKINNGIKECLKQLGKYKEKIDKFFDIKDGYSDDQLADYLEIEESKAKELLKWYARLELGLKIQKCVEETDSCQFEAEC